MKKEPFLPVHYVLPRSNIKGFASADREGEVLFSKSERVELKKYNENEEDKMGHGRGKEVGSKTKRIKLDLSRMREREEET